jgi:hypothetical protein
MADSPTSFPWKLYHIIDAESDEIIEWLSHGKSFRVNDPTRFANEIVPYYFKRESELFYSHRPYFLHRYQDDEFPTPTKLVWIPQNN